MRCDYVLLIFKVAIFQQERQELGERVMVTRLHLFNKWVKVSPHYHLRKNLENSELFSLSGVLVWSRLFCIQNFPSFVSFQCIFGLVWRFEQRTFFISSLRAKLILACQEVLNGVWHPVNH